MQRNDYTKGCDDGFCNVNCCLSLLLLRGKAIKMLLLSVVVVVVAVVVSVAVVVVVVGVTGFGHCCRVGTGDGGSSSRRLALAFCE